MKKIKIFFYGILLSVLFFSLTVFFLPKITQEKAVELFFNDVPVRFHQVFIKPVISTCFFQESKLSSLLDLSKFWVAINPNCFVDAEKLDAKIKAGLPVWARNQIESDLSRFSSITKKDLDNIYAKNKVLSNMLARFKIKDKQITSENSNTKNICAHQKETIEFVLKYLIEKNYIGNTDFIIALTDFFKPAEEKPVPIFTFAKDLHIPIEAEQILIPDWQNLGSVTGMRKKILKARLEHPWSTKKTMLFWRGSVFDSTGFRHKFIDFAKRNPNLINAEMLSTYGGVDNQKFVSPEDHLNYKYLISIDGNRASWERLVWHLYSNSLVFKHESSQVQWFYKGIKPYVHYVPVTDEQSILTKIDWAEKNPEKVQLIIRNAESFAENNLSLEDMYHYIAVLINEYNKKFVSHH